MFIDHDVEKPVSLLAPRDCLLIIGLILSPPFFGTAIYYAPYGTEATLVGLRYALCWASKSRPDKVVSAR
jgi:hypothetical protein